MFDLRRRQHLLRSASRISIAVVMVASAAWASDTVQIDRNRMVADVAALSSAAFHGRQTGTPDDIASAEWVAERLRGAGLQPTRSSASVRARRISDSPRLVFLAGQQHVARIGDDYLPAFDSPSVKITAPVIFVGFGIEDAARGFDEYANLDVRNRIVLFFRGKPERYPTPVSLSQKERAARAHGALGFIMLSPPVATGYEARRGGPTGPQAFTSQTSTSENPLPGVWIRTDLGEALLREAGFRGGRPLRAVQEALDRLESQSGDTELVVDMAWNAVDTAGSLTNVAAILPGGDETLREETVIVGAHRDHFGTQAGLLFPGADDNASGTAVLLETARQLASAPIKPRRTVVFLSFSGEEVGMLGSRLYVGDPVRPLNKTVAMINVDHAGVGNGRLIVGLAGVAEELARETARAAGVPNRLDVYGYFPGGDHVPFKEAGIATVTVVSGGTHPHFHRPTDTSETIVPEQLEAVARYVTALAWKLAN